MIVLRGQTSAHLYDNFSVLTSSEMTGEFRLDEHPDDEGRGYYSLVNTSNDRVLADRLSKPRALKMRDAPPCVDRIVLTRYPKAGQVYGLDVYLKGV